MGFFREAATITRASSKGWARNFDQLRLRNGYSLLHRTEVLFVIFNIFEGRQPIFTSGILPRACDTSQQQLISTQLPRTRLFSKRALRESLEYKLIISYVWVQFLFFSSSIHIRPPPHGHDLDLLRSSLVELIEKFRCEMISSFL